MASITFGAQSLEQLIPDNHTPIGSNIPHSDTVTHFKCSQELEY